MGADTGAAQQSLPPAIFVMGPTASGKTDLALELARELPCEIISVDSALVYRGMDIGTAKPSPQVLRDFPHRLVDICDPAEAYSAARFRGDALAAMAEIADAGRVPLLVGGTMLYFRALQKGLSPLPRGDAPLRAELAERARREGLEAMHQWLRQVDPEAAGRIHPNDPQRLLRALEVFLLSGRPMSALWRNDGVEPLPYRVIKLVRSPRQRAVLHQRIAARFEAMLAAGFEAEVRGLWQRGDLDPALPSMRCVGYRQMLEYIRGGRSRPEMIQAAVAATRQLAKRQFTWLRAETDCRWLYDDEPVIQRAVAVTEAFCRPAPA